MILYDIKNGYGTLTRLINDSTVYLSVTQMIDEATRLVENIKTEPKRYVQFSIFGKKDKSILDSRDKKLLKKFAGISGKCTSSIKFFSFFSKFFQKLWASN